MNGPPDDSFATTQWTRVLAARGGTPEAHAALRELCETYYAPVESFLRRGRDADEARELTQEFFARLLAGSGLDHLRPGAGRFRSYLLGAVKHFLGDRLDRERAAKRGGGAKPLSLDQWSLDDSQAGGPPPPADPQGFPDDAYFDREWALHLLEQVLRRLEAEQARVGREREFELLRPWLTGDAGLPAAAETAARLGLSEGAFRVAIHRLRQRFRQLVREAVAPTVASPDELAQELAYLVQALSHRG